MWLTIHIIFGFQQIQTAHAIYPRFTSRLRLTDTDTTRKHTQCSRNTTGTQCSDKVYGHRTRRTQRWWCWCSLIDRSLWTELEYGVWGCWLWRRWWLCERRARSRATSFDAAGMTAGTPAFSRCSPMLGNVVETWETCGYWIEREVFSRSCSFDERRARCSVFVDLTYPILSSG